MKPTTKKYFLYGAILIIGSGMLLLLIQVISTKNTGFETKTLWDWMELLIIPCVVALGVFYLNRSERTNELEIALEQQREDAFQRYIDRMSDLLLHENLLTTNNKQVRDIARIRTQTVLFKLDGTRKDLVLQFLYRAGLIGPSPIVDLKGCDLTELMLWDWKNDFSGVNLSGAYISNGNFTGVNLNNANLSDTFLDGAHLFSAKLQKANLTHAVFSNAELGSVDLTDANLSHARLTNANLMKANLYKAKMNGADLTGATLTNAVMPDGTKHD